MSEEQVQSEREEALGRWERVATGWGKRADRVRSWGMPVSEAMIDALALQPGERILELAAGPGDTGFLAAELIRPGGTLVSSDGTEAMLDVARHRAREAGVENVEFARLELEWIDLPTASVDGALCRWGLMLIADREAAAHEIRRVVKPGGRVALAVWDVPERNPWATIPNRALIELGHAEPPDPDAPGMFRLAPRERLLELLHSAGFVEIEVQAVELARTYRELDEYLEETADLSHMFSGALKGLDREQREQVSERIDQLVEPFRSEDGSLRLPGSSLVALAHV